MVVDCTITCTVNGSAQQKQRLIDLIYYYDDFADVEVKSAFDDLDLYDWCLVDETQEEISLEEYTVDEDSPVMLKTSTCYDSSETWYGDTDKMEGFIKLLEKIVTPAHFKIELNMEMTEGDWLTNFSEYSVYDSDRPSDAVNDAFNQMLYDVSDCCESEESED